MRYVVEFFRVLFGRKTDSHAPLSFVHIEEDGSARELEPDEIEYLNTEFHGADGGRPYIKTSYDQLTPDKKIWGYLPLSRLPVGVRVKTLAEATPVETAELAIEIAKAELPISSCIKGGTLQEPIIDPRTGRSEYGVTGIDVRSGSFSATLEAGVWRVVRTPAASAQDVEHACFADVSALSGRLMRYGRF